MTTHTVTNQDGSAPVPMDTWLDSLSEPQKTEFLRISTEHGTILSTNPNGGSAEWPIVWKTYIESNNLIHTTAE